MNPDSIEAIVEFLNQTENGGPIDLKLEEVIRELVPLYAAEPAPNKGI